MIKSHNSQTLIVCVPASIFSSTASSAFFHQVKVLNSMFARELAALQNSRSHLSPYLKCSHTTLVTSAEPMPRLLLCEETFSESHCRYEICSSVHCTGTCRHYQSSRWTHCLLRSDVYCWRCKHGPGWDCTFSTVCAATQVLDSNAVSVSNSPESEKPPLKSRSRQRRPDSPAIRPHPVR